MLLVQVVDKCVHSWTWLSKHSEVQKPAFTKTPEDVIGIEQKKIKIIAEFIGEPAPEVGWFKNSSEVFPGKRQWIETSKNASILTIGELREDDQDEYKVFWLTLVMYFLSLLLLYEKNLFKRRILWLLFFIHKNPSMLPPGLILRLSSYDLFGLFSHRSVNFHSKKAHLQNFPHSNFSLPTRFITIQLKAIPFKTGVMKQLTLYTLVKFFVTFILREKRIASTIRKMMLREDWINNMTTYVEQADTQNQYTQPYQRTLMV